MNALMRQALIEKLDREDGTVKVTMTSDDFCKAVRRAVLLGDWSFFEFEKQDHDHFICHVQEFDYGYKIRLLAQILGGRTENIVAMNVVESIDDFDSIFIEEILTPTELQSVRAKMNAGLGKLTGKSLA